MASQQLIDHLTEILKHEWTGVAQYSQASFTIQGVWREVYAEKFAEDAEDRSSSSCANSRAST